MNNGILIASDIHGSAYYCEKLVRTFTEFEAEKLLLLGDILYHGPRNVLPKGYDPMRCAEILKPISEKIVCVKGNCDAEIDEMVLGFSMIPGYAKLIYGKRNIYAAHGHTYGPDKLPPMDCGDILFYGHFHAPAFKAENGIYILNPGSVAIPKEGSPCSCILLQEDRVHWIDLDSFKEYRAEQIV